ncbi:MAG: nuclear transport factor 2 family protein [Acidimicrobiales bacterium]
MSITQSAGAFVDACDSGRGWEECAQYCHDGATFAVQADALAEISTVEGYVGWARDLLTPVPDGDYELKSLATDDDRSTVVAFAVFKGSQTGPGPVDPPTGNSVASDYVYVMNFDGDRIRHITKIWNDGHALGQLGWA